MAGEARWFTRTLCAVLLALFGQDSTATLNVSYVNVHDGDKVLIYAADSELMLGVAMPMTKKDSRSEHCIPGHDAGVQTLEALLFVLDHVNTSNLPFTIGAVVLDTCYDAEIALQHTLKLVIPIIISQNKWYKHALTCPADSWLRRSDREAFWKIVGLIGSESSEETLGMTYISEMMNIPHISHLATSPLLSDINEYPTFMRTIPADDNTARAVVHLLLQFGWTYVTAIYDDSFYSTHVYYEFEVAAKKQSICIAEREQIMNRHPDYTKALDSVTSVKHAKVVVVFALFKTFGNLLAAACKRNMVNDHVWIMIDTLSGRNSVELKDCDVYKNTLAVVPKIRHVENFDDRFKSFRPSKAGVGFNPWMTDYFEFMCKCSYRPSTNASKDNCTEIEEECAKKLWHNYRQDPYLIYITDAVLAYTEALTQLYKTFGCPYPRNFSQPLCQSMQPSSIVLNGSKALINLLRNVTFQSLSKSTFQFHNRVDGPPYYSIVYYENSTQWQVAGVYCAACVNGSSTLSFESFKYEDSFDSKKKYFSNFTSRCSETCKKNQATKYLNAVSLCCWACENCSANAYVNRSTTSERGEECVHCGPGRYVNVNQTGCVDYAHKSHFTNDWLWRLIASSSIAGLLATIVVAGLLWHHRETPIVKASDMYSNTILLFGCFLAFAAPFFLVSHPCNALCCINRFAIGTCETLIYATIFAKLMRIMFIFSYSADCKVPYVFKNRLGVACVVLLLLGVELLIVAIWVILDPPAVHQVNDDDSRTFEHACSTHGLQYLIVFALPLLLAIGSTYFAYRIRKVPNGFNDGRTVSLLVNSNGVLLISFMPLLVSDVLSHKYSIFGLSLLVQLNSTAPLCLMFASKLYVVLLHPEKNTKQAVMSLSHSGAVSSDVCAFGKLRTSSSSFAEQTFSFTSSNQLSSLQVNSMFNARQRSNSTKSHRKQSSGKTLQPVKRFRSHKSVVSSNESSQNQPSEASCYDSFLSAPDFPPNVLLSVSPND